ncbi:hypothetical protein M9Y10_022482 [Tritrichomonas musculus]|uniref:Uncharacterized protein n=1 Tax=Tritrichomonas musculus TaxID=1915356 RepID=A0ABR2KVP3_9EUKA
MFDPQEPSENIDNKKQYTVVVGEDIYHQKSPSHPAVAPNQPEDIKYPALQEEFSQSYTPLSMVGLPQDTNPKMVPPPLPHGVHPPPMD